MNHYIVEFYPPIVGLEDEFNTVRVGLGWAKRLKVGDEVYISDNKEKRVIGKAVVTMLETGSLEDICTHHSKNNHTQLKAPADANTSQDLLNIVQKFYGPHIAKPSKKATVIYLRRTA